MYQIPTTKIFSTHSQISSIQSIPFSFSAKSVLVWVLFDFSPTASWQANVNITVFLGQCMDSHGVFLQNRISVLHSLLSSLFLPQDVRQYFYYHIHWTLLLFAVFLSFSRLLCLNFFKDLVSCHISWTCSFHFLPQLLFLFPSSLHVFFSTSFMSAFIPLGQIAKKRLVMFSTFFSYFLF